MKLSEEAEGIHLGLSSVVQSRFSRASFRGEGASSRLPN